jgi:hypothetical protein
VPASRFANLDHNLQALLIEAGEDNLDNPWWELLPRTPSAKIPGILSWNLPSKREGENQWQKRVDIALIFIA